MNREKHIVIARNNIEANSFIPARTAVAGLIAVAVIVVGLLDVVSTNVGLLAGAVEMNPIMAVTQAALGYWWFVPKLVLQLVTVLIVVIHPVRPVFACVGGVAIVNGIVVANNFALAGMI